MNWIANGGTVNSDGWFMASAGGAYTIRAVAKLQRNLGDSVSVTVQSAPLLTGLAVTPRTVTLQAGASQQFAASGAWTNGLATLPQLDWSATGGTVSSAGVFTAGPQWGTYQVIARDPASGRADTSTVVVEPTITSVRVRLNSPVVAPGATQTIALVATESDSTQVVVAANWSATGGMITAGGTYSAGQIAGRFLVTGSLRRPDGILLADTAQIEVVSTSATLDSLSLTPIQPTVSAGSSIQLNATGRWSDGSTTAPAVNWSATGGTVSASGLFTAGGSPGLFGVTVTQQGGSRSAYAAISILAVRATSLAMNPNSATVQTGGQVEFSASAEWSDGQTHPFGVTYATTGGSITSGGLFSAGSLTGDLLVIATCSCGLVDTAHVLVQAAPPAVLTALTLTPSTATLTNGASQQFTIAGSWSDGSAQPPAVTYTATGGSITATGRYSAGMTAGTYRVIATQSGGARADTSVVVISAPQLLQLSLSPTAATLIAGAARQFTASATWSNGDTAVPPVTYSATGGNVTASGLYSAGSVPGVYRVIVTQTSGGRADTSIATVTSPAPSPVASVTISPGSCSLTVGDSCQLSATLKDAVGNVLTGRTVTWSSNSPTVASVSATSSVRAQSAGSAVISATSEGKSNTASITVTAATLRALAIKRGFLMGAAATTEAFTADAQYRQVLAAQYNLLVPGNELKFGYLHPAATRYNFTDADRLVAYAQANGMVIHGHTLIWDEGLPAWVSSGSYTKAQLLAVMKSHIATVVGRYRGKIASWDVVNEVTSWNGATGLQPGIWLNTIGPEYIDSAFVWAHAADPAAKLYLNDYQQETYPAKANLIFSLVQGLKARGIPIDGVGFQTHLFGTIPQASTFQSVFSRFTSAGFDIRVSEMDDRVPDSAGAAALTAEGAAFRDVLDACLRLARCTSVTTWGFTDRYSFIPTAHPGYGRGLPFAADYQTKPAFDSLAVRLRAP